MSNDEVFSHFHRAEDGLILHYLDVPPSEDQDRIPAVCLPGLARTTDDFRPLALALAKHAQTPRRVLCFDYRGRGLSGRDPDWRRYSLDVERADFLLILDALNIPAAHFIGTSRGGLHLLALTDVRPTIIKAAIFNDIGPVIEPDGLARIKGYLGESSSPASLDEAIALLKNNRGRHFTALSPGEWRHFAGTTFGSDETKLGLRYDPHLVHALDGLDLDKPLPDSWPLFDRLRGKPVLTLRGETSDLLSASTLAAMGARWPESRTMTVSGQGHAPLLADDTTILAVSSFLAAADAASR